MGGQKKAPARWRAHPGQAGSVLVTHDTATGNAATLGLAKLRALRLAGATAFTLAAMNWGGGADG
jgi:hypothetical protein